MRHRNVRRGAMVLGVAVAAAAVSALAVPTAAQAHHPSNLPGLLVLSPFNGALTDNPVADYWTTKPCPTNYRALATVALESPDGTSNFLTANFVPTGTLPSGSLDSTSLRSVVLANDLTTGYYEVDLLCFNSDFSGVATADKTWIKIDVAAATWRVAPLHGILGEEAK